MLVLNHDRYADDVKAGLYDKKGGKASGERRRRERADESGMSIGIHLFTPQVSGAMAILWRLVLLYDRQ